MSLCVGLTGGIASGKSTVGRGFQALGVPLIDADQVAREVVAPGSPGLAAVIETFGAEFLTATGELDRRRLREHVFAEPALRRQLEGLLHPRIKERLRSWREQLAAPYGLLMAPIMSEGGFDVLTDRMLVVDVDRETQKSRLIARDGISAQLAEQMLAAQASRAERLRIADDVLDNSGDEQALLPAIERLHARYTALATAGA